MTAEKSVEDRQTDADFESSDGDFTGGWLGSGPAAPGLARQLPAVLLGGQLALIVASTLIPSELASLAGYHVVLIILQFILFTGTMFSGAAAGRPFRFGIEEGLLVLGGVTVVASCYLRFDLINQRQGLNAVWVWLSLLVTYLTLRRLLVTEAQRRLVVTVLIGLATSLATYGLYQYAVELPAQRATLKKNPEAFLDEVRQQGIVNIDDAATVEHFLNRVTSLEPLATFSLTNSLAGVLAATLCGLIVLMASSLVVGRGEGDGNKKKSTKSASRHAAKTKGTNGTRNKSKSRAEPAADDWRGRVIELAPVLVLSVLVLVCFFLTKSRAGIVAVSATLLTAAGWTFLRRGGWSISPLWLAGGVAVVLLSAGAVTLAGGLDAQVLSEAPLSLRYRFEYWQSSAELIRDQPMLGVGPGNFQIYYSHVKLPQASETVADPHNFLVEMAATFGLPGCLLIAAALFWACVVSLRFALGFGKNQANVDHAEPAAAPGKWIVLGGGILGAIISFPAGAIGGYAPGPTPIGFAVIGIALTYVLLDRRGPWQQPRRLAGAAICGVIALLIHLLASGGISFPGVALMLWSWLAVAMPRLGQPIYDRQFSPTHDAETDNVAQRNSAVAANEVQGDNEPAHAIETARDTDAADTGADTDDESASGDGTDADDDEYESFDVHRAGWLLSAAMGIAMVVGCYVTFYRPLLQSRAAIDRADFERFEKNGEGERTAVAEAGDYDPLWTVPKLRQFNFALLQANERSPNFEKLRKLTEEIRAVAGPSATLETDLARRWLLAHTKTNNKPALREAINAYQLATTYAPSRAMGFAELAWAQRLAGDTAAARESAGESLRLNELNPHREQKLDNFQLGTANPQRIYNAREAMQLLLEPAEQ